LFCTREPTTAAYCDSTTIGHGKTSYMCIYSSMECQLLRRCGQTKELEIPVTVLPYVKNELSSVYLPFVTLDFKLCERRNDWGKHLIERSDLVAVRSVFLEALNEIKQSVSEVYCISSIENPARSSPRWARPTLWKRLVYAILNLAGLTNLVLKLVGMLEVPYRYFLHILCVSEVSISLCRHVIFSFVFDGLLIVLVLPLPLVTYQVKTVTGDRNRGLWTHRRLIRHPSNGSVLYVYVLHV